MQRTTISAKRDDLETLKREAKLRGVSFAELMREIMANEASNSRRKRRPKSIGIVSVGGDVARESVEHEDMPFLIDES